MGFGIPLRNSAGLGVGGLASLASRAAGGSAPPPGPVPALDLDFTTGVLDPRITFTRASQASYFDSAGQMQIAAVNQPRFDYDPVTLQPNGLLQEASGTNLLTNSAAPSIGDSFSVTAGAIYTISFYGSGALTFSSGTYLAGSGVYPSRRIYIFVAAATEVWTITAKSGDVRYAQAETGSIASSWIPTGASQATRAQDLAAITGTNFSSWFSPTVASIYCEFTVDEKSAAYGGYKYAFPGAGAVIGIWKSGGLNFYVVGGGANVLLNFLPSYSVGTIYKAAFVYKVGDYAAVVNNGSVLTSAASGGLPTTDKLVLGAYDLLGNYPMFGYLRKLRYYNTRLTNTELQALTT